MAVRLAMHDALVEERAALRVRVAELEAGIRAAFDAVVNDADCCALCGGDMNVPQHDRECPMNPITRALEGITGKAAPGPGSADGSLPSRVVPPEPPSTPARTVEQAPSFEEWHALACPAVRAKRFGDGCFDGHTRWLADEVVSGFAGRTCREVFATTAPGSARTVEQAAPCEYEVWKMGASYRICGKPRPCGEHEAEAIHRRTVEQAVAKAYEDCAGMVDGVARSCDEYGSEHFCDSYGCHSFLALAAAIRRRGEA